jgi:hypothetical protein
MNRNDIRPALIGVAAGTVAFGALVAWAEYNPWDSIVDRVARRQLSPAERAELDRITAEDTARSKAYCESAQQRLVEREERWAAQIELFDPQRLITVRPSPLASMDELPTAVLVDEIVQAQRVLREQGWNKMQCDHCDALYAEWQRRDYPEHRYTLPRSEQLQHDIFRRQVESARNASWTFRVEPPAQEASNA